MVLASPAHEPPHGMLSCLACAEGPDGKVGGSIGFLAGARVLMVSLQVKVGRKAMTLSIGDGGKCGLWASGTRARKQSILCMRACSRCIRVWALA